jgi:hypothetical protein
MPCRFTLVKVKVSYSPVLSKGFHGYLTPGPALGERDRVVRRLWTA